MSRSRMTAQTATLASAPASVPVATVTIPSPPPQTLAVTLKTAPEPHDYMADLTSGGIGLLGALVGAFAAYKFGMAATAKVKAQDQRDKELFLSFSVIHKLQKIYPAQAAIYRHIQAGQKQNEEKRLSEPKSPSHLSLYVPPFANTPERVSFTPDELICAGRVGGQDVFNALMILDGRHNTTLDMVDVFRADKAAFLAKTKPHEVASARVMQYRWSKKEYDALMPLLFQLDQTVQSMLESTREDREVAYNATVAMIQGRAKLIVGKVEFEVRTPDGQVVVVTRDAIRPKAHEAERPLKGAPS